MIFQENTSSLNSTAELCSTCAWSVGLILMLVFVSLNWMLTLSSGLWAVWLLTRGSRSSMVNEFFMLNLFCTDQASVFLCLVTSLNSILFPLNSWMSVLAFLCKLNFYTQPLFQCCVCVERYLAVVRPFVFLKLRPLRYKWACLLLLWLLSLAFRIGEMLFSTSFLLVALLLAVVCVQLSCNLSVLMALKRPKPGDGQGHEQGDSIKRRAFVIISLIQAKLLLNYLPLFGVASTKQLLPDPVLKKNLYMIVANMCFMGTFIQPILYLRRAGRL